MASFFPFRATYWINGHSFIERELQRAGIAFRKDDNAFLAVDDVAALQTAADRLSPVIIRKQLDYWTLILGPKFSKKERAQMNLSRFPFFTQTKEQDRCHVHSDPMSIRGQAFLRPGDTGESRPFKSCPASRTGIHAAIALRLAADSAAKGLQGGSRGQYNQQRRVDTPLHTQEVTGSSPVAPTIQMLLNQRFASELHFLPCPQSPKTYQ